MHEPKRDASPVTLAEVDSVELVLEVLRVDTSVKMLVNDSNPSMGVHSDQTMILATMECDCSRHKCTVCDWDAARFKLNERLEDGRRMTVQTSRYLMSSLRAQRMQTGIVQALATQRKPADPQNRQMLSLGWWPRASLL